MQLEKKIVYSTFSMIPKGPFDISWQRHDSTSNAIKKKGGWGLHRENFRKEAQMMGLYKKHMPLAMNLNLCYMFKKKKKAVKKI